MPSVLRALHQIALMDAQIALEIVRDGLRRDVLKRNPVLAQLLHIGLERAQVAAEHRRALLGEQTGYTHQKLDVVALHIPGALAHGLRVAEGGRVHEDQIEAARAAAAIGDPVHHIAALEAVRPVSEIGVSTEIEYSFRCGNPTKEFDSLIVVNGAVLKIGEFFPYIKANP